MTTAATNTSSRSQSPFSSFHAFVHSVTHSLLHSLTQSCSTRYSLFAAHGSPSNVIQMTLDANSPLFGVEPYHSNQLDRVFILHVCV